MKPQQVIAAMFAGLKANRFIRFIPGAEALVLKCETMVNNEEIALNLPPAPTWQQVVDAVFTALIAALPAEATLLRIFQAIIDALFTAVPKVA